MNYFCINYITWFWSRYYKPNNNKIIQNLIRYKENIGYNENEYLLRFLDLSNKYEWETYNLHNIYSLDLDNESILSSKSKPWFIITHSSNPFKMDTIFNNIHIPYKQHNNITIEGSISNINYERLEQCSYFRDTGIKLSNLNNMIETYSNYFSTYNHIAIHILWEIIDLQMSKCYEMRWGTPYWISSWNIDNNKIFDIFDCFEGDFTIIIQTKQLSSLSVYSNNNNFYYIKDKLNSIIEISNSLNISEELVKLDDLMLTSYEKEGIIYWKANYIFLDTQHDDWVEKIILFS